MLLCSPPSLVVTDKFHHIKVRLGGKNNSIRENPHKWYWIHHIVDTLCTFISNSVKIVTRATLFNILLRHIQRQLHKQDPLPTCVTGENYLLDLSDESFLSESPGSSLE